MQATRNFRLLRLIYALNCIALVLSIARTVVRDLDTLEPVTSGLSFYASELSPYPACLS